MRILVIATDFPPNPGGVALFVHNLCCQLVRRHHNIDVLTRARRGFQDWDTRQPYRTFRYHDRAKRFSSRLPISRAIRLHRREQYDAVFVGHFTYTHALGAVLLKLLWGVPYLVLSHGNDLCFPTITTSLDKLLFAPLLRRGASMMLGNSTYTAHWIRKAGYRGPVAILNPGVDPERFHPSADTEEICRAFNLDGREVLLTVSRLTPKKNILRILRALPTVLQRFPRVVYLIVGSGAEEARLREEVSAQGLSPHVHFMGHIENEQLPSWYCVSDLFVMPSCESEAGDIETFGISYIEANACGLPVIGGRAGGVLDAVIDGETGVLVDPTDVGEIASAILRLLADPERTRRLGENGRRRVERELTWEQVGRKLEEHLYRVVSQRGTHR